MRGNADAAAHDDPVHDHDIGFGKGGDAGVEFIFLAPEVGETALLRDFQLIKNSHVAAGAKTAIAGARDEHGANAVVVPKFVERAPKSPHHRQRQRVERLRPVEENASEPARARCDEIHGLLQQRTRDDDAHDFIGSFENLMDAQVTNDLFDSIFA